MGLKIQLVNVGGCIHLIGAAIAPSSHPLMVPLKDRRHQMEQAYLKVWP